MWQSKKTGNVQKLIQLNPTSYPEKKGKKHTDKLTKITKDTHVKPNEQLFPNRWPFIYPNLLGWIHSIHQDLKNRLDISRNRIKCFNNFSLFIIRKRFNEISFLIQNENKSATGEVQLVPIGTPTNYLYNLVPKEIGRQSLGINTIKIPHPPSKPKGKEWHTQKLINVHVRHAQ